MATHLYIHRVMAWISTRQFVARSLEHSARRLSHNKAPLQQHRTARIALRQRRHEERQRIQKASIQRHHEFPHVLPASLAVLVPCHVQNADASAAEPHKINAVCHAWG